MHGTLGLIGTYKTAEELGISDNMRCALMWFINQVDEGKIEDIPEKYKGLIGCYRNVIKPKYFDMDAISVEHECGTAGCILGWINHRITGWDDHNHNNPTQLYNLFFHYPADYPVLAADAREATVRFLRGEPAWPAD